MASILDEYLDTANFDPEPLIQKYSKQYNLDSGIFRKQMKAESNFNPYVTSHAGAQGLMQLMPGTAKELGVTDSFDPNQNVEAGARYLRQQLDRYGGDYSKALAAYNAGPGNVDKHGGIPPFKETQDYVAKIYGDAPNPVLDAYLDNAQPEQKPDVLSQYLEAAIPDTAQQIVLQPSEEGTQKFDPEGQGYDYESAINAGIRPDSTGHWPSREPKTGQILKGRKHETFHKTEKGEEQEGFEIYQSEDGKYYSRKKKSTPERDSQKINSQNPWFRDIGPTKQPAPLEGQGLIHDTTGKEFSKWQKESPWDGVRTPEQYGEILAKKELGEDPVPEPEQKPQQAEIDMGMFGGASPMGQNIANRKIKQRERKGERSLIGKTLGEIPGIFRTIMQYTDTGILEDEPTFDAQMGKRVLETKNELLMKARGEQPGFKEEIKQLINEFRDSPKRALKVLGTRMYEDLPLLLATGRVGTGMLKAVRGAKNASKTRKILANQGLKSRLVDEGVGEVGAAITQGFLTEEGRGSDYGAAEQLIDVAFGGITSLPLAKIGHIRGSKVRKGPLKGMKKMDEVDFDKTFGFVEGMENHPKIKEIFPMFQALVKSGATEDARINVSPDEKGRWWTREELDKAGYTDRDPGNYTEAGKTAEKEISLTGTAGPETVVEEATHYLQSRIRAEDSGLQKKIKKWETSIREKAGAQNLKLPEGDELFGQAFTSHMGYADKIDGDVTRVIIPADILDDVKKIMGDDPALQGAAFKEGDVRPEVESIFRQKEETPDPEPTSKLSFEDFNKRKSQGYTDKQITDAYEKGESLPDKSKGGNRDKSEVKREKSERARLFREKMSRSDSEFDVEKQKVLVSELPKEFKIDGEPIVKSRDNWNFKNEPFQNNLRFEDDFIYMDKPGPELNEKGVLVQDGKELFQLKEDEPKIKPRVAKGIESIPEDAGYINISKNADPIEKRDEFGDLEEGFGPEYNLVEQVFIKPKYRGKGYGRRLIEEGISKIDNDLPIRLSADPMGKGSLSQKDLVKLYEKMGFIVDDYTEGMSGVTMTMDHKNQLVIKPRVANQKEIDFVKKEMGTTENWEEAGYINPDGTLLDFSGKRDGGEPGYRAMDHREVRLPKTLKKGNGYSDDMLAYLDAGGIRVDVSSGLIDLHLEPTAQQRSKIADLIRSNHNVSYLEIGDRAFEREYLGVKPARVLKDIDDFFNGKEPKPLSIREQIPDKNRDETWFQLKKTPLDKSKPKELKENLKKLIKSQKSRVPKAALPVYDRWVREVQVRNFKLAKLVNDLEREGNKTLREAVPFAIEKTNVPDKLNRPDIQKALDDPKKRAVIERMASRAKFHFDETWDYMVKNIKDLSADQIENYVTHIWDLPEKKKADVVHWFTTRNPQLNKRLIATIAEGIDKFDLKPKTLDIKEIVSVHGQNAVRTTENKILLDGLKELQDASGQKLILPTAKAPNDWVSIDHPVLNKVSFMPGKGEGDPAKIIKTPVKYHPDLAPLMRAVFAKRWNPEGKTGVVVKAWEGANAIMKQTQLAISLFHHIALGEASVATVGPIKTASIALNMKAMWRAVNHGEFDMFIKKYDVAKDGVDHGLMLGANLDVQKNVVDKIIESTAKLIETKTSKKFGLPLRGLGWAKEKWDMALWDYYHNNLKLAAYETLVSREIKKTKNLAQVKGMKVEIASMVNDTFGGQNLAKQMSDPNFMRAFRAVMLSPDWLVSTLKQAGSVFGVGAVDPKFKKLRMKMGAKFWVRASVYFGGASVLFNYLNTKRDDAEQRGVELKEGKGKWMWENDPGHETHLFYGRDKEGKKIYLRHGKQFRELPEFLYDSRAGEWSPITATMKKLGGKGAPVPQALSSIITGKTLSGYEVRELRGKEGWEKAMEITKYLSTSWLPFSLSSIKDEKKDFSAIQFMLPTSKGMSQWKTRTLFKNAILSGNKEFVKKIWIAAEENNISDVGKTYHQALKSIITDATEEYKQSINRGDDKNSAENREKLEELKKMRRVAVRSK